jgi:hypothetical protein
MKENVLLRVTSLLAMLLLMFHLTEDVVLGYSPGGLTNLTAIGIWIVWLFGAAMLAERRSGQVIMLIGGLIAAGMPVLHLMGKGVAGEGSKANGAYFFIWTLYALGVLGVFTFVLAVRALRKPVS